MTMEADRTPGLYFTGNHSFLDLAQEIKDHIYGFCTEELRLPAIERALRVCSEATIDHGLRLNMLLVSKQLKREYEKERENSDWFERKLTTYFDTVFGRANEQRAEDNAEDDDSDDEANDEADGDDDAAQDTVAVTRIKSCLSVRGVSWLRHVEGNAYRDFA